MTITLDTLTLPDELIWMDEYAWSPVGIDVKYSIGGRRRTSESKLFNESGRLITLSGENAWIQKSDVDILFSWSQEVNKVMSLTLHNASVFSVKFRFNDPPVFSVVPVIEGLAFPDNDTWYKLTLGLEVY